MSPFQIAVLTALSVGGLLCVVLAVWMIFFERHRYRVRNVVLPAGDLGLPPLRILQITDTHFHGRDEALLSFLKALCRAEDFDLVFFVGDIIDDPDGLESAIEAGAMLRGRIGTFAVLGGHDYARMGAFSVVPHVLKRRSLEEMPVRNPAGELQRGLERVGVTVLQDENVVLNADGARFAVVGLRDAFQFEPDYAKAWAGLPPDLPVIVIAHSPDVLQETADRGARLALFGHTHGGQVRFPVVGAVVTRSSLPPRLAAGTFRHRDTVFTLNNGSGTSPATPYRLLCPPEVSVVDLRADADRADLTPVEDANLG